MLVWDSRSRWSPLQSPTGRSDHSRDDSLIADDASSTGNKDDDDDDDEDDANDENDGFSRDPERLKAFNVSNLVLPNVRISQKVLFMPVYNILFINTAIWCSGLVQPAKAEWEQFKADAVAILFWAPAKNLKKSGNEKTFWRSPLREVACIGVWCGGNTNLGSSEAGPSKDQ